MASTAIAGTGVVRVTGSGAPLLRHNIAGTGVVRVKGTGALLAKYVLGGTGAILVKGSGGLELVPPTFSSVVATNETTIRVTFDTAMLNNTALSDPASYEVTATGSGAPVAATGATPEAVAEPTYVDLVVTEMTDGEGYELSAIVIEDIHGLTIDLASFGFTGVGVAPQVSAAVAINAAKVRVIFDEPMDQNGTELANPSNYTITPDGPGAAAVFITSVIATGKNPTSVDLITSEMTDGESYTVKVDSSGSIRDSAYNPLDSGFDSAGFTGAGDAPEVLQVAAVSSTRVDISFSENMLDNADIRDPSNYVWDNGLITVSVLDFEDNTVKLVTTEQDPGLLYELTIA